MDKMLVIKFGTDCLCGPDGRLCGDRFTLAATQIKKLVNGGVKAVVVSSGAIKAGKESLRRQAHLSKAEYAGIGMPVLMRLWDQAFAPYGANVAQLLVTYANWQNEREKRNLQTVLCSYCRQGIVPIVNENDPIADEEIKLMEIGFSENDRLAGMVAELVNAKSLLLVTASGGVFTKDPRTEVDARIYTEVNAMDIPLVKGCSTNGSGGIAKKLSEASRLALLGHRVAVGSISDIYDFGIGKQSGTMIGTANSF